MHNSVVLYGLMALLAYSGCLAFLNAKYQGGGSLRTKLDFMLASRQVPVWLASMSVAASWIWITGFFVGSQVGYTQGWIGMFWFVTPNVLALAAFAWFVQKMRSLYPDGFTLSEVMSRAYSPRVQLLYAIQLLALAVGMFAVHLIAAATLLAPATGWSPFLVTVVVAVCALGYSFVSGLRGSLLSSSLKLVIIASVFLILTVGVLSHTGTEAISKGLYGKDGQFVSLFSGPSVGFFFLFGLVNFLNLFSGPFGDQVHWQRGFAVKGGKAGKTFLIASILFLLAFPLWTTGLGIVAAGSGLTIANPQLTQMALAEAYLPTWVGVALAFAILVTMTSMVDVAVEAISTICGHDLYQRLTGKAASDRQIVTFTRMSMLGAAGLAIAIANAPGIQLIHVFLTYGALRTATFIPTVWTLLVQKKDSATVIPEAGMFWGILLSLGIGFPMLAYGNFTQDKMFVPIGAVTTFLAAALIIGLSLLLKKGEPTA